MLAYGIHQGLRELNLGTGRPPRHPLEGFTGSMLQPENESQERRRHQVADQVEGRVVEGMQNPPEYVEISIGLTMFFIGGDAELIGGVISGGRSIAMRQGSDGLMPLVIGAVKKKAKKKGGPKPNGGTARPHGGRAHDAAIDARVRQLQRDPSVRNVRKNQAQVDANGNKVGNNRPDVQFDRDGCHHCVEYDTKRRNGLRHRDKIRQNDPSTKIELHEVK